MGFGAKHLLAPKIPLGTSHTYQLDRTYNALAGYNFTPSNSLLSYHPSVLAVTDFRAFRVDIGFAVGIAKSYFVGVMYRPNNARAFRQRRFGERSRWAMPLRYITELAGKLWYARAGGKLCDACLQAEDQGINEKEYSVAMMLASGRQLYAVENKEYPIDVTKNVKIRRLAEQCGYDSSCDALYRWAVPRENERRRAIGWRAFGFME